MPPTGLENKRRHRSAQNRDYIIVPRGVERVWRVPVWARPSVSGDSGSRRGVEFRRRESGVLSQLLKARFEFAL